MITLSPTLGLNRSIAESRALILDLQQQLATGKKVNSYGDLGLQGTQILSMRSELSQIEGYMKTIDMIDIRLNVMTQSLDHVRELASLTRSDALLANFELNSSGQTFYQAEVSSRFDEVAAILNMDVDGRHLFGGRETEQNPLLTSTEILNGSGSRAGFKQIVSERRQADLGADGRGRLVLSSILGTASISEDAAGSPFGFKLNGATSTLSGTTLTGPAGAPPNLDVTFSATLPNDGETIQVTFDLPDGTSHDLQMTARSSGPIQPGEFLIGADENVTAANFQTAITSEIETEAQRSLSAASLFAASNDFFDFDAANPPQRVNGPPFDTATALVNATVTDTVFWYQGEDSATDARQSALVKVDDAITVEYGARANEDALRQVIKTLAAVSVEIFDPTDVNAADRNHEIKLRTTASLSFTGGAQDIDDIIIELTVAQTVAARAHERHQASDGFIRNLVGEAESVDIYEVSAQIISLSLRVEASLQVSVSLSRLSLLNFF